MIALISSLTFIYCFLAVAIIGIIISLELEKEGTATTFLSLAVALLFWNYGSDILAFVNTNYLQVIGFAISYVLVGIFWSFLKWNYKVKGIFKKLGKIQSKFLNGLGQIPEESLKKLNKEISKAKFRYSDNSGYVNPTYDTDFTKTLEDLTPKGDEYKSVIVAWISYWPLSLIGTLVNNPFRHFFNWVYDSVSGTYDKVTKNQIKNYIN